MPYSPHPFTLRQLQYVIAVAEERSFRRAAERCHVSQPSLSAQLAQVEEMLGVRLFERNKKPVIATAAGEEIVARARRVLLDADDLVRTAKRFGDPLAGTLRLGVIPTISPYLLPCVAPALRGQFLQLTCAWIEDKTEQLLSRLASGTLEAALLALEAEIGDVEHETIARDPFVVAMPASHPLAQASGAVRESELPDDELLLLDDGHCFRQQALAACSSSKLHEAEFRATSLSTLVQMVAGGAGVTLLPGLAVATEAARAGLSVRPLTAAHAHRTIALVWRKGTPLATALRKIAAVLRGAYPTYATSAPREARTGALSRPNKPSARSRSR